MVVPLIMSGAALASSALGAMSAHEANQTNQQIGLLNYYEQVAARQRAEAEARRQQNEAKLGQTDAAGNRTYFVPGVGWVTDLAQDQQQIQDLSEQEMIRQLTEDAARNERVGARSNNRRNREDTLATEADRELRAARRPDQGALRQLLLARGAEARNRSADRAGEASARQAVRQGGHNAAAIRQGARAEADATGARQAGIEAELMARGMADQEFAQDRDSASQLYNYFRGLSTGGTAAPGTPQLRGPSPNTGQAANFGSQLIAATGQAPQQAFQNADMSMADFINDAGASVGGLMQFYQNSRQDARKRQNTGAF